MSFVYTAYKTTVQHVIWDSSNTHTDTHTHKQVVKQAFIYTSEPAEVFLFISSNGEFPP